MTGAGLQLLLLEDDPLDAELALQELTRYGLTFCHVRVVATQPAFRAALTDFAPDLILADYRVPGMSAEVALDQARAQHPQVPFIFVSGTLGEDHAVDLMRRGAWDYVVKDRLSRLGPAVARALAEARERRRLEAERQAALTTLQERTRQLQAIVDTVQDGLSFFEAIRDETGRVVDFRWVYANPNSVAMMRRPAEQVAGTTLLGLLPSLRDLPLFQGFVDLVETGEPLEYLLADFSDGPVRGTFEGRAGRLGDGFVVVYRDVTDREAAARALRRSEARYRGLVLALGEGIVVQDAAGAVVECNEAAERILGVCRSELVGRRYPPPEPALLREDGSVLPVQEHPTVVTAATGRSQRGQVIGVRRPQGDPRWVLANAEPMVVHGADDPVGVITSYADLTELRRAQQELRFSEERFRLAFEEALTGMALIDLRERPGGFLRVNRALTEFLGRGAGDLLGTDLSEVVATQDRTQVRQALTDLIAGRTAGYRAEQRFTNVSGLPLWAVLSISVVHHPGGGPRYALAAMEDITARKDAEEELAYKALHDQLTGLPNRALLLNRLQSALSRADRAGTRVGVLFIDLDDFKSINDSFGHEAGDRFLVEVAHRIQHSRREVDTAARIGGDEFVVVCEQISEPDDVMAVAQRIQIALGNGIAVAGERVSAPASIGIAISRDRVTPEGLLREADQAMYSAKRRGGRRWHPAEGLARSSAHDMLVLEADLREAIRLGQLRVYYQPTFDLSTDHLVGVEALLRWQHPARGLLLPEELIEVAERRNLIATIGSWVLSRACSQAADWLRRYGERAPVMAVNISSCQLGDELSRQVQHVLRHEDLPPDKLCLEVTESQFISVGSSAAADLRTLSDAGVVIAVDDFGTGFAGFDYLRRLPVHMLKIDRSYISGLGLDRTDSAIVAGVVTLARNLGLTTVAEGIETGDQHQALQNLGCSIGQGWYWYPAMPPEQLESLLDQARPEDLSRAG